MTEATLDQQDVISRGAKIAKNKTAKAVCVESKREDRRRKFPEANHEYGSLGDLEQRTESLLDLEGRL